MLVGSSSFRSLSTLTTHHSRVFVLITLQVAKTHVIVITLFFFFQVANTFFGAIVFVDEKKNLLLLLQNYYYFLLLQSYYYYYFSVIWILVQRYCCCKIIFLWNFAAKLLFIGITIVIMTLKVKKWEEIMFFLVTLKP